MILDTRVKYGEIYVNEHGIVLIAGSTSMKEIGLKSNTVNGLDKLNEKQVHYESKSITMKINLSLSITKLLIDSTAVILLLVSTATI
ncbi:hypothetical protein GQ457_06G024870 [Hibiscus cannabinus]